jgi:hypothetical protein
MQVGRGVTHIRRGVGLHGKEGEGVSGFLPKQRGEEKWGK